MLDLTEILKNVPLGTKLYSPLFTDVSFMGIRVEKDGAYTIDVEVIEDGCAICFSHDGRYIHRIKDSECMLFPSKENRDWSTYFPPRPDLQRFTPCICFDGTVKTIPNSPSLRYYAGHSSVYVDGQQYGGKIQKNFIIPYDKFDFKTGKFDKKDNYGTAK